MRSPEPNAVRVVRKRQPVKPVRKRVKTVRTPDRGHVFAFGVLRALWQENRQEPLRVPARGLAMSIWLDDLCVGSPNFEIRLPLEYLQELEQLGCIEIRPVRRRGHEVTILLSVQLEFAR